MIPSLTLTMPATWWLLNPMLGRIVQAWNALSWWMLNITISNERLRKSPNTSWSLTCTSPPHSHCVWMSFANTVSYPTIFIDFRAVHLSVTVRVHAAIPGCDPSYTWLISVLLTAVPDTLLLNSLEYFHFYNDRNSNGTSIAFVQHTWEIAHLVGIQSTQCLVMTYMSMWYTLDVVTITRFYTTIWHISTWCTVVVLFRCALMI